jgi:hypothetical protein
MGVLSLLGGLNRLGLIPARKVMECIVNPHDEDFDIEESPLGLPVHSILNTVVKSRENNLILNLPSPEPRIEYADEYESLLVATILQIALSKAKVLQEEWDNFIENASRSLVSLSDTFVDSNNKIYKCPTSCLLKGDICGDTCDPYFKFNEVSEAQLISDNSLLLTQILG